MKKVLNNLGIYIHSICFVFSNSKGVFVVSTMFYLLAAVIPYISVTALEVIVYNAEKLYLNEITSQKGMILGIGLFIFSFFFDRLLMLAQMPLSTVSRYRIISQINKCIAKKSWEMEYSKIESAEYQIKLESVRKFAENLPNMYENSLNVFKMIISVILLALKFNNMFYIPVIIAISSIPMYVVNSKNRLKKHRLDVSLAAEKRVENYYKDMLLKYEYVKERKIYELHNTIIGRWDEAAKSIESKRLGLLKENFFSKIFGEFISVFLYMVTIVLLLNSENVTASTFTSLSSAILVLQTTYSALINKVVDLKGQLLDYKIVYEYLNEKNECDGIRRVVLNDDIMEISFDNVSFSYAKSQTEALKRINVNIKKGELVAIVGENGAGKSTFIKLLLGMYKPNDGKVLVNGIDVTTLESHSFFCKVSAIFQKFNRYPFTFMQNIDLFSKIGEEPTERIGNLVKQCGLESVLEKMQRNYDTLMTHMVPDGVELSGGEWQKLAVVRGLNKEAQLIIMDEPTASMDPLVEVDIYNNIKQYNKDGIKIIVTHHMGIASKADRILMFNDGKLVSVGTHEQLMESCSEYEQLFYTQKKLYNL